jgi:hypothetical protein
MMEAEPQLNEEQVVADILGADNKEEEDDCHDKE